MDVNVGSASRPPNSERYRLLPLAKLTEHLYYYKHMAHRSPYRQEQIQPATEATTCKMRDNRNKPVPTRRKPNSDTTPTSDGQIQRPEMTGNGREIEISELTFRQQAARDTGVAERTLAGTPRQVIRGLGQLWHRANPYGGLRSVITAKAEMQG